MFHVIKKNTGFTLIELLVVSSLIVIFTSAVLISNATMGKSLALSRATHKLSQDLRRAQEMSMSARIQGASMPSGYGLHFYSSDQDSYVLFADLDGNRQYNPALEKVEEVELEKTVSIGSLLPAGSELTILFEPPLPLVVINFNLGVDYATTTLTNGDRSTVITVNKAGLIEVVSD